MTKADTQSVNGVRRSTDSLRLLIQLASERGMPADACLQGTGLSVSDLTDPHVEIAADQEFTAIRNLQRRLGADKGLGLQIGLRWPLSSSGILAYALLSCTDVRTAFSLFMRYCDLTYAYFPVRFEEDEHEARLLFDDESAPVDLRQFLVERIIGALWANSLEVLGSKPPVIRAELRFSPPSYAASLRALSPAGVRFNAEQNVIATELGWLDRPLPRANTLTQMLCEQQCEDLLKRRRARVGRSEQVRRMLLRNPAAMPDIDQAAGHFSVTGRSLRRQLADEGTSYRELVDEVRYGLAEEFLLSGFSVEDVAERLGFSEAASFVRAFRRWSGTTPGKVRRARAGEPDAPQRSR